MPAPDRPPAPAAARRAARWVLGGIVAGGALALADYGALWLWLSGWDLRLDALWRLGALLLAAFFFLLPSQMTQHF